MQDELQQIKRGLAATQAAQQRLSNVLDCLKGVQQHASDAKSDQNVSLDALDSDAVEVRPSLALENVCTCSYDGLDFRGPLLDSCKVHAQMIICAAEIVHFCMQVN